MEFIKDFVLDFYENYPSQGMLEGVTEEELSEFLREASHNACAVNRARKIRDLVCKDAVREQDCQFSRERKKCAK